LIDDNFIKTYTFQGPSGNHEYTLLIYTEDTAVTSTSVWTAQLYNYDSKKWDVIAASTGRFTRDPRTKNLAIAKSFIMWWPETALFSDAHPLSDTDDRECTGPTPQYRGLERLQLIEAKELADWLLPCHFGNIAQLIETAWYGPHPTPRITRIFPLIGPFQDL
jgi:hypothetical protein